METLEIKKIIKDKYGNIVSNQGSAGCCGGTDFTIMSDEYHNIEGYNPDADFSLGCGIPTEHAGIKKGDTVLDLGSGAGNDVFVARSIVGETGKVIGLDMTEEMIAKANSNKAKLAYDNIEFILGEIEQIPLDDNTVDVIISNCVLNLVPDKEKAFAELYRVLKLNAHFCISDIVIKGALQDKLKNAAELYAGCVAGALPIDEYMNIIKAKGFKNISIKKEKEIFLPDKYLLEFLNDDELQEYRKSGNKILSITVYGEK